MKVPAVATPGGDLARAGGTGEQDRGPRTGGPGLTGVVDGLTGYAVLAFAAWTLVYDLGLLAGLTTGTLLLLWAPCVVAAAVWVVRSDYARPWPGPADGVLAQAGSAARSAPAGSAARSARLGWIGISGIAFGVAAGVAAGLHRVGVPWAGTWVFGLLSVAAGAWQLLRRRGRAAGDTDAAGDTGEEAPDSERTLDPAGPRNGSVIALCTALGAAIFSLFIVRPNADDAYFVNRSVWIAQHGRIPVGDVLFTSQGTGHLSGETPVASIEALLGALARLFDVPAAAFTYYVALPVATFFAVWAVWLLIRRWAPVRQLSCFAVAMVYLAMSGSSLDSLGSFSLVRMWQGKAMFVSVMVPLLYAYLTEWAERPAWSRLAVAVAASVAAVGLTSSAIFVVPLITAAAMVPIVVAGRPEFRVRTVLAAALVMLYPLGAALASVTSGGGLFPSPYVLPVSGVWTLVMMGGVMGAIGGIALWTAPRLARRGVPSLVCLGVAGITTVLLVPGVLAAIGKATGSPVPLWRTMWTVPGPVLVGLLATAPLPAVVRWLWRERWRLPVGRVTSSRWLALAPALAACAVMLVAGRPLWSRHNQASIASRPSWKYGASTLALAGQLIRADHEPGDLLAPHYVMGAIPLITSKLYAVDGREYYLNLLPASRQFISSRRVLTQLADAKYPLPSGSAVKAALAYVSVGYACTWRTNTSGLSLLGDAGYSHPRQFRSLVCLTFHR